MQAIFALVELRWLKEERITLQFLNTCGLSELIGQRRAKLSALTSKINAIEKLMIDEDNLQNVQYLMQFDFVQLLTEFMDLIGQIQDILPQDEKIADQQNWFQPKMDSMRLFENKTKNWIAAVGYKKGQDDNVDMEDDVSPHDSASQVSVNKSESKKKCDSDIESRSVSSSISSAYAREGSKRARTASLKKKGEEKGNATEAKITENRAD